MYKEFHGKYYYMEVPDMSTAKWIRFVAYRDFNKELSQADISIDIIRGVSEEDKIFVVPTKDEMYIPVTYFHRTPMYKVWEKLKAYKTKYVRDVKLLEGAQK